MKYIPLGTVRGPIICRDTRAGKENLVLDAGGSLFQHHGLLSRSGTEKLLQVPEVPGAIAGRLPVHNEDLPIELESIPGDSRHTFYESFPVRG